MTFSLKINESKIGLDTDEITQILIELMRSHGFQFNTDYTLTVEK